MTKTSRENVQNKMKYFTSDLSSMSDKNLNTFFCVNNSSMLT